MNTMQDFIQAASQKFGISEEAGKSASGGLLQLIKKQAGGGDFDQLLGKVPGASEVFSAASAGGGGEKASGGLGGLMGAASSALGGKLGSGMNLGSLLSSSGLDMSKAGGFVSMFVGFLKEKAGGDLVNRLLSSVPELKKMTG